MTQMSDVTVSDVENVISDASRDIVDNIWTKAKAFGRQEFAMEVEQIIENPAYGKLLAIKALVKKEIDNRQLEIGND